MKNSVLEAVHIIACIGIHSSLLVLAVIELQQGNYVEGYAAALGSISAVIMLVATIAKQGENHENDT